MSVGGGRMSCGNEYLTVLISGPHCSAHCALYFCMLGAALASAYFPSLVLYAPRILSDPMVFLFCFVLFSNKFLEIIVDFYKLQF